MCTAAVFFYLLSTQAKGGLYYFRVYHLLFALRLVKSYYSPPWFLIPADVCWLKSHSIICCNTLWCDESVTRSPSSPHIFLSPFSLIARGRGCQSSCAPHLGRSASTAKELWVSVSLHGNTWQLIAIITTHTKGESSPSLLLLALVRKSLQRAAARSEITMFQTWASLQHKDDVSHRKQHRQNQNPPGRRQH